MGAPALKLETFENRRCMTFHITLSVVAAFEFSGSLLQITFTNEGKLLVPRFNLSPDHLDRLGQEMMQSDRWRDFPVSGVSPQEIHAFAQTLRDYVRELGSRRNMVGSEK
jgi:hypothetical protein